MFLPRNKSSQLGDTADQVVEGLDSTRKEATCAHNNVGFGLEGPSLNDYNCIHRKNYNIHNGDISGNSYAASPKSSSMHLNKS